MNYKLQEISCLFLRLTGIPWFLREVYARRKITIINYHNPEKEIFSKHLQYFDRHYSFISIDRLVTALNEKKFSSLPVKPLLITFDDGYKENANLFHLLKKYHVPAVIYVVAGVVDTNRNFWFDLVPHSGEAMHRLKTVPDRERRQILEETYKHVDEREYDQSVALSRDDLLEFIGFGGTVGSHTIYHPLLNRCSDKVGLNECFYSKQFLSKMLGVEIKHFALPNGNYDDRTLSWIKCSGYCTTRTTRSGWVESGSKPFSLNNFGVADDAGAHKVAVQSSGLWNLLKLIGAKIRGLGE